MQSGLSCASKYIVDSFPIMKKCDNSGCLLPVAGHVNSLAFFTGCLARSIIDLEDGQIRSCVLKVLKIVGSGGAVSVAGAYVFSKIDYLTMPVISSVNLAIMEIFEDNVFSGIISTQGLSAFPLAIAAYNGYGSNVFPIYACATSAVSVGYQIGKNPNLRNSLKENVVAVASSFVVSLWSAAALGAWTETAEMGFASAFYEATTASFLSLSSLASGTAFGYGVYKLAEKISKLECVQNGIDTVSRCFSSCWNGLKESIWGRQRQPVQIEVV